VVSAAFLWFCHRRGYTLYSGDATAHVNIARRVVDSRTPGYEQLGTVWLPLPHALMLPLVRYDSLWRSGLAGAIPAAACFILAAAFLYAALRRATGSRAAAVSAVAVFSLNPNLLYLQSTPMTEPIFFAAFAAVVYFCVSYQAEPRLWRALAAGAAMLAATLTRYEGWFAIPFVAVFFLLAGSRTAAAVFLVVAGLGPLYWLGHNWYFYGDALEFYRGPYSAQAIYARGLARGHAPFPGEHDLPAAWLYYRTAAETVLGRPVVWLGGVAAVVVAIRRTTRPLLLLAAPAAFYLLSLYGGGTEIFLPSLRPFSYYNTRYALAALPFCAAAVGALVALCPRPLLRAAAAAALMSVCLGGWAARPSVESWVCWKEAEVNSRGRRAWTQKAAEFFRDRYAPGDGILTASGDVLAIYQTAGIPLRETLHDGSQLQWYSAVWRPDLFLRQRWVVALAGDTISFNLVNPKRFSSVATRVAVFSAEREPVIEVWRKNR
jgi:hypothetical protein